MVGILLVLVHTLFFELSSSIGKAEVQGKKESIYIMGFLGLTYSTLWFFFASIFFEGFKFSAASLPTLIPRLALDVIIAHWGIKAVVEADRSTYSFFRIATIPLLIVVDLALRYTISPMQWLGIAFVVATLGIAGASRMLNRQGLLLTLGISMLAAAAISLYKYNITHFNGASTEQFIAVSVLWMYFYTQAYRHHQSPFSFLFKWPFSVQALAHGLATPAISYAYLFAPASIILTTDRAVAILLGIISGKIYFRERHVAFKLLISALLIAGVYLLFKG